MFIVDDETVRDVYIDVLLHKESVGFRVLGFRV
jgi:hypothetical protein